MTLEEQITDLNRQIGELQGKLTSANNEAKGHRLNFERTKNELEQSQSKFETEKATAATALEQMRIDLTARATAAEGIASAASERAKERVRQTDLKLAAREAGMVDLDGLKLLDVSKVKTNAEGEVENAADLMAELKTAKPWLYGQAQPAAPQPNSTASGQQPPDPNKPAPKSAMDMSPQEARAALAGMGVRL